MVITLTGSVFGLQYVCVCVCVLVCSCVRASACLLGFTTASSGATGRSAHAVVDESFAHISRHG